ncbi:hypothetical protein [Haladaptatus caseinilyticus]|uniref:hypothetical protein n=1 Tax=Haladaptatus caseinilyticus TaxID=2993314 RepID=UPI00224AEEC5|nr:hypothetical protein [Haladaptatus caseinilyticus]
MRRRHLVTLLGTAAISGCFSRGSTAPPILGEVDIVNFDYKPHTVHVFIERDGHPVYWADHEATARTSASLGGASLPCVWDGKEGKYIVRARLNTRTKWQSINLTEYDSEILGLSIHIGDTDAEEGAPLRLSIWHTSNARARCQVETTMSH